MKCSKCNQEKTPKDFYKDKRTKSGLYSACRKCHLSVLKIGKNSQRNNRGEYMREYIRKYRKTDKWKNYTRTHKRNNRIEYMREYLRKYKDENREYLREYAKKHRDENNETYRKYWQTSYEKKKKDPKFRIDSNVARAMGESLKGKKSGRSWESLVGYTVEDLTKHLESKFETWMTWDNYGKWHIDHIKPQSLFKFESAEDTEFRKCWSLDNLQPLEAMANMKKGNKFVLDKPLYENKG